MNDRTFWGILAAILVVWVAVFFVMVFPKLGEYDEVSKTLEKRKTKIVKYSRLAAAELPTEALVESKRSFYEGWRENIEQAVHFYEDRDRRLELGAEGVRLPDWISHYRRAFDKLAADYRKHAGLDAAARLPFKQMRTLDDAGKLPAYEKQWRMQQTIVRAIMDHPTSKIDRYEFVKSSDKELRKLPVLEHFHRMRAEIDVELPPAAVTVLLSRLLGDEEINFEVHSMLVIKARKSLKYDTVEEIQEGEEPGGEPPVKLLLRLDALDYHAPVEPEDPEEKDSNKKI